MAEKSKVTKVAEFFKRTSPAKQARPPLAKRAKSKGRNQAHPPTRGGKR